MIIRNIKSEQFMGIVNRCCGDVFLHLNDGRTLNVKRDDAVVRTLGIPASGVQVTCADRSDTMRFIRSLVGIR